MYVTCPNCDSVHRVERDEDGESEFETAKCADPDCDVLLCESTCQELSFACECSPRQRRCNEHAVILPNGEKVCSECAKQIEADEWPEIPKLEPITVRPILLNTPEWRERA